MEYHLEGHTHRDKFLGNLFFHKYKPLKKLGEGSFGTIYMAENIIDKEVYALKFEDRRGGQSLLESEAYVMSYLKGGKNELTFVAGIPTVKSFGYSGDYNILVMELLGKSLEDILNSQKGKKFSIKTVCMLACQIINTLEQIHSRHIIHRDIKPDNFVMGINENTKSLYLLDFGLARKYRSSTTGMHYPMKNRKKLTGTARYASINALKGLEQSRRDDLEAVGYVIMYFLRGSLPWQGLPVKTKEDRYKRIMEKKQFTSAEELCEGFPQQFVDYVNYTRRLAYEEDPDYTYLKNLFISVMTNNNYEFDYYYDWVEKPLKGELKVNEKQKVDNGKEKDVALNLQKDDKRNNISPDVVETVICEENRPKHLLISKFAVEDKEIEDGNTKKDKIIEERVKHFRRLSCEDKKMLENKLLETRNLTTTCETRKEEVNNQLATNNKLPHQSSCIQLGVENKNNAMDNPSNVTQITRKNKKDKGCNIL